MTVQGAPTLERRLASFRAAVARAPVVPRDGALPPADRGIPGRIGLLARVEELAAIVDGEVVRSAAGTFVRIEQPSRPLPVDRERLAALPGQPPAGAPLVCLDTETTGLATAAGTLAFLVGLGWWEGDRFRQVQLLLPDHADERAVLDEIAARLSPDAWLVTYNGRGFDWPLLVARYRLARRAAPVHAGHLDLLPLVRRIFRHRMEDARLRTVEGSLLGIVRHGDVEGWEIPGRYLEFLRGGSPVPLVEVVRHNDEDVRTLARLLGHVERRLGDVAARASADPGDVAGLGRAFAREQRLPEALECLEVAIAAAVASGGRAPAERDRSESTPPSVGRFVAQRRLPAHDEPIDDWWSPRRAADFGGPPRREPPITAPVPVGAAWTHERLSVERAHLLRRLGRHRDAEEAWFALASGTTRIAGLAAIELAKVREHRLRDLVGAMAAVERGWSIVERRRRLGRPEPALERDLVRRGRRLRLRLARRAA